MNSRIESIKRAESKRVLCPCPVEQGAFTSEKDFFGWLISSHNLTICDVGAGTEQMLYKGQLLPRPSTQACDFGPLE